MWDVPDGHGLCVPLAPGTAPGWCRLSLRLPVPLARAVAGISAERGGPASLPGPVLLPGKRRGRRVRHALVFLPAGTTALRLRLWPVPAESAALAGGVALSCTRLARPVAAALLVLRLLPRLGATLLRGLWRAPGALPGRLRSELAAHATAGAAPSGPSAEALWRRLFDRPEPMAPPARHGIAVVILHAGAPGAALAASLAAAREALAQLGSPIAAPIVLGPGNPGVAAAVEASTDAIALLQAGEVLAPDALCRLAQAIEARSGCGLPPLDLAYADEDRITPSGRRDAPLFKPSPSRSLMLSGTLATGVWLLRRPLLASCAPTVWAEALRLEAWLRLHEAGGAAASARVPLILTHRRPDTEVAPAAVLAAVAAAHCARSGLVAQIRIGRPLHVRPATVARQRPPVSLIVPSACRDRRVLASLRAVLAGTDYAPLDLVLVLTAPGPPDPAQRAVLERLSADPRVRPVLLTAPAFNFAAACNHGARAARGSLLCLLNDDVTPRDRGWLAAMVGHLGDPAVGVVGARLLYPDATVQHAGVVLCPDGTGTHWHRFLPAGAPGYAGRARLAQEVSAVTGACLLTRRTLWDRLGGLDESFATAFNDVDFCLRARAAGAAVVLAAEAELTHAESRSFGRHYRPGTAEAARNHADRARLLARFPDPFRADPFHSPNLSPFAVDPATPRFPPADHPTGHSTAIPTGIPSGIPLGRLSRRGRRPN